MKKKESRREKFAIIESFNPNLKTTLYGSWLEEAKRHGHEWISRRLKGPGNKCRDWKEVYPPPSIVPITNLHRLTQAASMESGPFEAGRRA